ncbi:aldo/keto reductase [Cytobacillus firmus]|uniref:aldo/keto reductase n=1 Tax=Cytobacillus firmus TaxID=1399 RepID=UPI002163700D|nr:aldo/keto reductase [Cytobacillus firmus]MCS0674060.1 aldo/keto reductase [Cytobacillus firmus]
MKLGIGTAQFGMKYGLTNNSEKTGFVEAKKIMEMAQKHGIPIIDTAKAYGNSEEILGKLFHTSCPFNLITKIPKLTTQTNVSKALKHYFFDSLNKLNQSSIYGLLLHNSEDLLSVNGDEIYDDLLELKEKGYIKKVGISVYDQEDIERIIEKYNIDMVQLPLNIFDQRFKKTGYLKFLRKLGIEIHARSIFLQGLLIEDPKKLPSFFDPIKNDLIFFQNETKKLNISPVEAALNFVLNIDEVDYGIIGVNNSAQLEEILVSLNKNLNDFDFSHFAIQNEQYIKPMNWKID